MMKTIIRGALLLLVITSVASGEPSFNVTVTGANSKVAFHGLTKADGTFATGKLPPGHYVVFFHSESSSMKGDQYLVAVSSGKKMLISNALSGEKFGAGGIAVKMDVGTEKKITGQVANAGDLEREKVRVFNGRRYFWTQFERGSNLGGHWVEEGSAGWQNFVGLDNNEIRKLQDRAGEGSMVGNQNPRPGHQ